MFGKRTSAPKRVSQGALRASSFATLLHEVAPDIILRELSRSGTTWTPELYRGVISVLLRSSTSSVANRAYRVLQNSTQGNAANRLGFTALTSIEDKRSILYDVLSHAVRDEMLAGNGAALSFYSDAGNGATDGDEYDVPERDGLAASSSFGQAQLPLRNVRRLALCLFLRHITSFSAKLIVNDSRLRSVLVNDACVRAESLHDELRDALQSLLHVVATAESVRGREDIVSSLVTAFSTCASGDTQSSLGVYLNGMYAVSIQHDACLVYLQQRFGVKKSLKRPLTGTEITDNILDVEVKSSRNKTNKVLPGVVAALCSSWIQEVKEEEIEEMDDMMIARMISIGEELIRKCNPTKSDATWLRMVLHDIKTLCSL